VCCLALAAAGCSTAQRAPPRPVLGLAVAPNVEGLGTSQPAVVFYGGDPTGRFTHITWSGWGQAQAIGHGTGWWVGTNHSVADGKYESVTLVARDLASCRGRRAYRHLVTYFPQEGETSTGNGDESPLYDLCNQL
jgi:hypothetical protein